jgi:dihydropteroate synthase
MRRVLPVIEALAARFVEMGKAAGEHGAVGRFCETPEGRVQPALPASDTDALQSRHSPLISIDTSKAAVARAALECGADIVNDVTGLRGDAEMARAVRETDAAVIVMHMQGTPRTMQEAPHYDDVVAEVREFFRQSHAQLASSGVNPMNIAFDPGIGFGKTVAHNLALLKNLGALRVEDRPLVLGVSRKSFIGKVLGDDAMDSRLGPTVALTAHAVAHGANIVRVHDVKPNSDALRMMQAILHGA